MIPREDVLNRMSAIGATLARSRAGERLDYPEMVQPPEVVSSLERELEALNRRVRYWPAPNGTRPSNIFVDNWHPIYERVSIEGVWTVRKRA